MTTLTLKTLRLETEKFIRERGGGKMMELKERKDRKEQMLQEYT